MFKACRAHFSNKELVILDCGVANEAEWREAFHISMVSAAKSIEFV
jgi:hypothetical protein